MRRVLLEGVVEVEMEDVVFARLVEWLTANTDYVGSFADFEKESGDVERVD